MKVKQESGETEEPLYPDYWLLQCLWNSHIVSTTTARDLLRKLTRWPRPWWISIVDIAGARVLIRTTTILSLEQSSVETRALLRRFREDQERENPEASLGL